MRNKQCGSYEGGPCKDSRVSYRIVAGVWVLATLVFVQAYQSTLITYVIAPVTTPLINSVYDLAENTNINFVVRRGGTLEYLFKVNLLARVYLPFVGVVGVQVIALLIFPIFLPTEL